ncbi:MAG: hypothetical protein ACK4QW_00105 [Alphaproteobacteria bacterium]
MLAAIVSGAAMPAAARDCPVPDRTEMLRQGAEICVTRAAPDCFGCEPGFVHRCIDGLWRPSPERRCGTRRADVLAGSDGPGLERTGLERMGIARAGGSEGAWPGSIARAPRGPSGTVPFRHCRYFDADGSEIGLPAEAAARASELGLVAWQRCETVHCRLYGRSGEPLHYAADDQDLVLADIRRGHISVQASECVPPAVPGRETATGTALEAIAGGGLR